ncbi:MAG: hypothetical protein QOF60_2469, partial [Actinomycetota bacterium]|nr:hypothetical protein [Actinomycetota bacterium]
MAMTEVSERYRRLSDAFAAKIAGVPEAAWSNETPCEEWTARDLVAHVVATQGMFEGLVGRSIGDLPSVEESPAAAWDAARSVIQRNLEDPSSASVEFDGFSGRSTFEAAVDRFLCTDLVVHGWDLARATGQDETIAPEVVTRVKGIAEGFGQGMR